MHKFIDTSLIKTALQCLCPQCHKASIFKSPWSLDLKDHCDQCGLSLENNDNADGPAVFIMFILGFSVVPLALIIDMMYTWPAWLHAIVWTPILLGLTLGMLKPLKSYIIALDFKYRR